MSSSTTNRIAFLFGAGVSIPAGMPSTDCITEQVLCGENVPPYNPNKYDYGCYPTGHPKQYVPYKIDFLIELKKQIDTYYTIHQHTLHKTNYEELYYMADQILAVEAGYYGNPAVQPLIDKIKSLPDIKTILESSGNNIISEYTLLSLADKATEYIEDIVIKMIKDIPKEVNYLRFIKDALQERDIDIFTLNHDTVVEKYLGDCGIEPIDGFESLGKIRLWNPETLTQSSSKIRLLKLHGSINWYYYRFGNDDKSVVGIYNAKSQEGGEIADVKGRTLVSTSDRPIILIGTFNKMLRYTSGIFQELHYQFLNSLNLVSNLIVCGYGFGDQGINLQIWEWINSSQPRRIVIIDKQKEINLKGLSRFEIRNNWDNWKEKDKLKVIGEKDIVNVSWEFIKEYLLQK